MQNTAFTNLDRSEQIALINQNWQHTEPVTAGIADQNFQCKNLDECMNDFDNFNHDYRFIGRRNKRDEVIWTCIG